MPDTAVMSPKQLHSIRHGTGRVCIWEGAIRSGKTIASLLAWLIYLATAVPPSGVVLVISRTRESAGRNVFAPLQDAELFGDVSKTVHYTPGAPSGKILGRAVHVLGASDAKSEKVLRGLTGATAYVDEITVLSKEFFTQLLGRLSLPGARLFGTTNPDSPAHWLKVEFLDRIASLPGWVRFHFLLRDNPSLTKSYVDSVSAEYTGLWYKRFILGEWVSAEGAIYSMWDKDTHVVPLAAMPAMAHHLAVGIDYGTTNPTAALTLGLGVDGRLYLTDEWRHDPEATGTRLTDAQQSAAMRAWMAARAPHRFVVADPSAASLRLQLAKDGTITQPADNDVAYGIRTMASLLGNRELLVSEACAGFIAEAPGYVWDRAASNRGIDQPVKAADHSLDAGRYAVITTEALWRPVLGNPERLDTAA